MLSLLENCKLCPRNCNVNRLNNSLGYCAAGKNIKIARVSLHMWEEPCISGINGSGTIFFSHCNLNCVFCQNYSISQNHIGKEISISRLSDIFLEQQKKGAHNINLVTPTHYVPQIIEALKLAKENGLTLPILYNSNGYENVETIQALNGHIDVYLPDLKYFNDKYAILYSNAPNYFVTAKKIIEEMVSQVGEVSFDESGLIKRGVIVRHLLLPSLLFDSKKIIDYLYTTFKDSIYISLMNQFTPLHLATNFKELEKPLNPKTYDCLIEYALSLGLKNGFIQEAGTSSASFVPEFDLRGV